VEEIKIFESDDFGTVKTADDGKGNILFCGLDIAKSLGYSNPRKAISDHCKKDGVTKRYIIDNLGRKQETSFISEGNVYRLIARSKMPQAEKFEKWVFDEILPSIRRHGAYMTDDILAKTIENPDFLINLLTEMKEEKQRRIVAEEKIKADRSKVLFAESVEVSKGSILVGDLAKLIKQNGYEIGQKRLFEWLRANGYLMKSGNSYNMPTQYAMELGLFEVKEHVINNPDGSVRVTRTPKVTGKGQRYFINKFLGDGEE
jgi:prophage antirepressor-like protein